MSPQQINGMSWELRGDCTALSSGTKCLIRRIPDLMGSITGAGGSGVFTHHTHSRLCCLIKPL